MKLIGLKLTVFGLTLSGAVFGLNLEGASEKFDPEEPKCPIYKTDMFYSRFWEYFACFNTDCKYATGATAEKVIADTMGN